MQINRLIVVLATAGCLASIAAPASAMPTDMGIAATQFAADRDKNNADDDEREESEDSYGSTGISDDESGDDEREESENESEESSEIYETGVRPNQPKEFERAGLADRELTMPPVVVRPDTEGAQKGPKAEPKEGQPKPIELADLKPTKKTPADAFVESATVGVGVMAAGALALGAVAMTRGSKTKRDDKSDYLYGGDEQN